MIFPALSDQLSDKLTVIVETMAKALVSSHTPLVRLRRVWNNPNVEVHLKIESANPGMSIKDRIAQHILDRAEASGMLCPGGTVCVASSGNTACAFAMMCAQRGYKCIVITNEKCSDEKVNAVKVYGAEVIIAPSGVDHDDPQHYQNIETRLCRENPSYFGVNQYDNPLNPESYELTLCPEIHQQLGKLPTHVVAAASTGGTITALGRYFGSKGSKVVMPDPSGSIFKQWKEQKVLGKSSSFFVEGVGKDSIPGAIDFNVVDEVVTYTDQDAFRMCHLLAANEGLSLGGSSGLNVHCAVELAKTLTEGVIVAICPDSGVKYMSKIYNDAWLAAHGFESMAMSRSHLHI
ncbi:MAG: uncharacterized protein KVP18_005002 [Porospora cf. gigantea A]|uniref:uncharacterized protein n=1 Tax=Porospora cf. gigantea A TaxID=2853593 RepID=UPI003559D8E9|nr:MAG: hypothetical protein KVP18_005002 [Porospora cf. gigantea A]